MTETGAGTRHAGFRIDRDGVWHHEGVEVTHPGVAANLYANLRRDAQGYYLALGAERIPVAVDDTPFVVTRLEVIEAGGGVVELRARLSDGTVEPLDPTSLWLDSRHTPYCTVKGGAYPARLSLAAWLQLAQRLDQAHPEAAVLVLGGRRIRLPSRA